MVARVTVAMRYPVEPPLTSAQAEIAAAHDHGDDDGTDQDGAPVAGTAPARG